jgi:hypothetical protein
MAQMKFVKSRIRLTGCQIKSLEIAKEVAAALDTLEKLTGIHSVYIELKDCFVCPDIEIDKLNETPMERVLASCMKQQYAVNRKLKYQ